STYLSADDILTVDGADDDIKSFSTNYISNGTVESREMIPVSVSAYLTCFAQVFVWFRAEIYNWEKLFENYVDFQIKRYPL
ncbi:uncharacterized protein SPAPADRAFT_58754, partial [Spathaspora passalidarum NRRL Y-27907]